MPGSPVISVVFGFLTATLWGLGAIPAARSSRRIGELATLAWVMLIGLVVAVPIAVIGGAPEGGVATSTLGWLALAGVTNVAGLACAYAALRRGKVGVVAAFLSTEGAAAAVEALMRTTFARYRDHLDLFSLTWRATLNQELEGLVGPDELERVRPVNEMLYGETERRLRAAQRTGAFPRKRNPRRFAFTAHMAVIGVLNMMAIAAAASDPLIHAPDDLIDDLCETFCAVTRKGGAR